MNNFLNSNKISFTIKFNSQGNHGHQLKDALGGVTIGHLFDLEYLHIPYEYLDYFGIGYESKKLTAWINRLKYNRIKRISGPFWNGFSDYDTMRQFFNEQLAGVEKRTLVIFDKALRVHLFQTIPWHQKGLIKTSIFSLIQKQVSHAFASLHPSDSKLTNYPLKVAVHINRGVDYNREKYPQHFANSYMVRYMFPMKYFENIMDQIETIYGRGNVHFDIYTERLNSEEIVSSFGTRPNTTVRVGSNREEKNYNLIHSIFLAFVQADILVCSNSSFSSMAAYYRAGKKTIYHPHAHLDYLPEPEYIKTSSDGTFDTKLILLRIEKSLAEKTIKE